MPPHILYRCSVFAFFDTETDVILIKNVDHVFCQIFHLWRFRLVCLFNNLVPASQVGFQQFRSI